MGFVEDPRRRREVLLDLRHTALVSARRIEHGAETRAALDDLVRAIERELAELEP